MAKISTDKNLIEQALTRGVSEVIDLKSLSQRLRSGDPLRIKLGIDPTGPRLHLGRSIPLLKLRDFQQLGHQIVLIVGDFTGQIGDTSDKDSERPMLTKEQVQENMRDYEEQLGLILDLGATEIHYNSEWLEPLDFGKIAKLADAFSVHEFIEREVIKRRLDQGKRVNLREMLYPIMQGYDSVAIQADVEIGGTDQRFNLLAGRVLTKQAGLRPQDILMTDIISGTDGKKMSTSLGNTVCLNETQNEMFGAIMSTTDDLIIPYFNLLTRVPTDEIDQMEQEMKKGENPRTYKLKLASTIVEQYHGNKSAKEAEEHFIAVFSNKQAPSEIRQVKVKPGTYELASLLTDMDLAVSKSEAKRLIEQKAVRVDSVIISDPKGSLSVHDGMTINVGKRQWAKLILG